MKRYDPPDTRQLSIRPRTAQQTVVTSDDAGVDYSTALLYNPELRRCTAEQHTTPPRLLVKAGLIKTCRILIGAYVLVVKGKRTAGSLGQRMDSYSRSTVAPLWTLRNHTNYVDLHIVRNEGWKKRGGNNALKTLVIN